MNPRFFLDTNVFIYAFEYNSSNSAMIIELLNDGEIDGVVSIQVIKEVVKYFETFHTPEPARHFRRFLFESCTIILHEEVKNVMNEWRGKIKDKDLEQLAAAKKLGIRLISYDRDFEPFDEYCTPKEFVRMMKMKMAETEY